MDNDAFKVRLAHFTAFLAAEVPRWRARWGADAGGFDAGMDWQRRAARAGYGAPGWPESHGGLGLDSGRMALMLREGIHHGLPPVLPSIFGLFNVGPTIMRWGSTEQKALFLPRIVSGEEAWCQGFSEPGAGSDLAALALRAVPGAAGFRLSGQKIWTSQGDRAARMMLLARTGTPGDRHRGISAFLVDMATPGITARPIPQITGEEGFSEVWFDDVDVPATALMGPLHGGWQVAMSTLDHERAALATLTYWLAHRARQDLARHQGQDRLMDVFLRAQALDWLSAESFLRADSAQPAASATVVKILCADTRQDLARAALEAAVEAGDMDACLSEYLRSRASTIAGGSSQVLRTLLAERALGLPR